MPISLGSPPDLSLKYTLESCVTEFVLPDPNKFALYGERYDLTDLNGNNAGKLYFTGTSIYLPVDGSNPNSFIGTLDFGEMGNLSFLWCIPPNLALDPATGFYVSYQNFYCRILGGSGDFKFIQNGFVVINTFPGYRLVYVYLDK